MKVAASFRSRIVLAILSTVMIALIPASLFVFSYGDTLTRSNLYNQLDVSMNDIMIRFCDTIGDYAGALETFSSSDALVAYVKGDTQDRQELADDVMIDFGGMKYSYMGPQPTKIEPQTKH